MEEDEVYHQFLLSWDDLGPECIFDIDAEQSRKVESALRDEPYRARDPGSLMQMLMLRARYNGHRNPEVYAISMPLTEPEVRDLFESNFDTITALIRKKGLKLF